MKLILYISVFLSVLLSCSRKLSPSEYLSYTKENKDEFSIDFGKAVLYRLTYVTAEQILAENRDSFSLAELRSEYKKMQAAQNSMFKMQVTVSGGNLFSQSDKSREEQMEYYSVHFKKYIKAITKDSDTIDCNGYFFQANGGFGPSSYFEFDFPKRLSEIEKLIVFPRYLEDSSLIMNLSALQHDYPQLRIK